MIKLVVFGILTIFCLLTFRDYSISPDEYLHIDYGELVLKYLGSFFSDKSFKSYHNLRFYGGWFDMVSAFLAKLLGIKKGLSLYYLKHLLTSLTGLIACYGVYQLSKKFVGEYTALLAALVLFTATAFHGQMFYNPKDIPFAAGYIWSVYFLLEFFERKETKSFVGLVVTTGLTLGIRAGGVLVYPYFILAFLISFPVKDYFKRESIIFAIKYGLLLFLGTYFIAAIGWPYLLYKPFKGLYESILIVSNFGWDGDVIFEGKYFFSKNPPWHYFPKMFAIKTPLLVAVGSYLLPVLLLIQFIRKKEPNKNLVTLLIITLFPLCYAIIKGSTVYNGIRQFLFTLPLMVVLAAYFWEQVIGKKVIYFLITQILASTIVIIQYYPYHYMAYNELVGGTTGADGKYELEYWSMSRAQAAQALQGKQGTFYAPTPLSTFNDYLPGGVKFINDPTGADYLYILKKSGVNSRIPEGYGLMSTIKINQITLGQIVEKLAR